MYLQDVQEPNTSKLMHDVYCCSMATPANQLSPALSACCCVHVLGEGKQGRIGRGEEGGGGGGGGGFPKPCCPAGFIVSGPARLATVPLPLPLIGSKELCQQLRFARASPNVAAVVLRLDTPGTTYLKLLSEVHCSTYSSLCTLDKPLCCCHALAFTHFA